MILFLQELDESEKNNVRLFPQHLFEVVGSLAEAGHNEGFEEVIDYYWVNWLHFILCNLIITFILIFN